MATDPNRHPAGDPAGDVLSQNVVPALRDMIDQNEELLDLVDLLTGPQYVRPFELSHNIPADTPTEDPATVVREMPYTGTIVNVVIGWADGADNAAGIKIKRASGEQLFPTEDQSDTPSGYISENDFTHSFPLTATVEQGDQLVAEYINLDSEYPHKITCIPSVRRDE